MTVPMGKEFDDNSPPPAILTSISAFKCGN